MAIILSPLCTEAKARKASCFSTFENENAPPSDNSGVFEVLLDHKGKNGGFDSFTGRYLIKNKSEEYGQRFSVVLEEIDGNFRDLTLANQLESYTHVDGSIKVKVLSFSSALAKKDVEVRGTPENPAYKASMIQRNPEFQNLFMQSGLNKDDHSKSGQLLPHSFTSDEFKHFEETVPPGLLRTAYLDCIYYESE